MGTLYSIFFAAGVAGFVYAKFGRRIGYGNSQSVWLMVGISFVLTFIFFYTLTKFYLHAH